MIDIERAEQAAYNEGYRRGVERGKPKWIPCEKRLPEETMLCLVTIKEQAAPIIDWWLADEPTTPDPVHGKWKDNKLTHIAWMPLMEPYEERRNNG